MKALFYHYCIIFHEIHLVQKFKKLGYDLMTKKKCGP